MPALVDIEVLAAAISGAGLALLGLLFLLVRPWRAYTTSFGCFFLLWGGSIVLANLARADLLDGDVAAARSWFLFHVALYIPSYLPLVHFAATYPHRRGFLVDHHWSVGLVVLPAVMSTVALLVAPDLVLRTEAIGSAATPWGPLYIVHFALLVWGFAYCILRLATMQEIATQRVARRRSRYALAAVLLLTGFWWAETAVLFGSTIARDGLVEVGYQGVAFLLIAASGLAVLFTHATRSITRARGRNQGDARMLILATGLPVAFGIVSAISKVWGDLPTLETLALWRLLAAALLAYALLRYELFDIDLRLSRGVAWGCIIAVGALLAVGLEQVLERWVGSTGIAVTLSVTVMVAVVAISLHGGGRAPRGLAQRLAPAADAPDRLGSRRLEVYEAALARSVAEGTTETDAAFLGELRQRLTVTDVEHELLLRLVSQPHERPARGGPRLGPGTRIADRYQLGPSLGRGTFGEVFLGMDERLVRKVVVKVLHEGLAGEEADERVRRFLAEARLAAGLAHPHIVRVYDFGYAGARPFLVLEHMDGGTLAARVADGERLAPAEAVRTVDEVLAGLEHIHAAGLLHRDLKLENVLLDARGTAKVTDFGASVPLKVDHTATGLDAPGLGQGTPATMAPEAMRGDTLTPASDVYAAGAMLYQLLTGRTYLAFASIDPIDVRRAILEDAPDLEDPAIDRHLAAVLGQALAKDPKARYRSASEMREDLRAWRAKAQPFETRGAAAKR